MPKLAILDSYHGDFSQGFEIALEVKGNSQSLRKVQGKLPLAEEIPKLYQAKVSTQVPSPLVGEGEDGGEWSKHRSRV